MQTNPLVLAATLGTLGSAFGAFMAATTTKKAAEESFVEARQSATLSYVQSNRERARHLRSQIGLLGDEHPDLESPQGRQLLNLIELWEHQAAGLNDGVFDLEIFNKMTGGLLLSVYRDYAPWIRAIRREDASIYDQLEVLVDKLIVMRSSGFVVNRKICRELAREVLTSREIRRLSTLKRQTEYTFSQLQQALLEIGLDVEKNRITRVARQPLGRIKPYAPGDREQTIALFESIQSSTGGMYPPRNILEFYYTEGREGISAWLERGSDSSRLVYVLDDTKRIIGHVEVQTISHSLDDEQLAYWIKAFPADGEFGSEVRGDRPLRLTDLAIVKRLGVHPDWRGRDIGRQLLRRGIHMIEQDMGQVPALVVLKDLSSAQALYESEGGRVVGRFHEVTGEAMVSYIF